MSKVTLHELNNFDNAKFSSLLSGVYEHSPWVIEKVANYRPFNTIEALHHSCISSIKDASSDAQLSLIRAHPDLAAKLDQLQNLTEFSQYEQSKAGFASLPFDVIEELRKELVSYRQHFKHPFILCLAEHSAVDVLPILKTRLLSELNAERTTCLFQITRIGWHRLCSIV